MKLYLYTIVRDYGFAPNPFYNCCTLATCKPRIRKGASVGDWVVGTGGKTKYNLTGHLIYAMKVDEVLDFNSYWNDPRFQGKRPVLNGSIKQLYGDNIYHRDRGQWVQADSHHSFEAGRPNAQNIVKDTNVDHLLIGKKFVYFGSAAPLVPERFRPYSVTDEDLSWSGRGHRVMSHAFATAFESWLENLNQWGLCGMPLEFNRYDHLLRSHGK
jgi:hypothetical protein